MTKEVFHNQPDKAAILKVLALNNIHQVPKITKVVINIGVGKLEKDQRAAQVQIISEVIGQKLAPTKASRSIAGFKIRAGQVVGYRATLRGKKMWLFLNKLINVALPRTRDFQGLKKSGVTNGGTLNIGIKDLSIFPEVKPDMSRVGGGLEICVVSTALGKEQTSKYFRMLGFPIEKDQ